MKLAVKRRDGTTVKMSISPRFLCLKISSYLVFPLLVISSSLYKRERERVRHLFVLKYNLQSLVFLSFTKVNHLTKVLLWNGTNEVYMFGKGLTYAYAICILNWERSLWHLALKLGIFGKTEFLVKVETKHLGKLLHVLILVNSKDGRISSSLVC